MSKELGAVQPDNAEDFIRKLPDTWIETKNGVDTVRSSHRKNLPSKVFMSGSAVEGAGPQLAWWLPAPFRFCLHCGIAYNPRQQSDFGKLATLGSEGRSTATTVMTLSTIRKLRGDDDLVREARKLLSFTDNRQDASLQAGHFNDFVEIALLRLGTVACRGPRGHRGDPSRAAHAANVRGD